MSKNFVYKVRHKPTGLFWKGGGINGHARGALKEAKSDGERELIALEKCFSKAGKIWGEKVWVKSALSLKHEIALNTILLRECEIVEYEIIQSEKGTEDIQ